MVGKGKLIDTNKFSVLSFNIPGNCFGNEKNDFVDELVLGDVAKAFNQAILKLGINNSFINWWFSWWRFSLGNGYIKS